MEKIFYLIGGANGSGKTTFAKELIKRENLPFLNADEIALELSPSNPAAVPFSAGKEVFAQMENLIQQEKSFALESTLSGRSSFLLEKMNVLREKGYKVCLVYTFLDSPQTCIERIKERVQKGGHHVQDEDVKRRYTKSLKNFWDSYKSNADIWTMYYNGGNVNVPVALGRQDQIFIQNEKFYKLFMKNYNSSQEMTENQTIDTALEARKILDKMTNIAKVAFSNARAENRRLGVPNVSSVNGKLHYECNGKLTTVPPKDWKCNLTTEEIYLEKAKGRTI